MTTTTDSLEAPIEQASAVPDTTSTSNYLTQAVQIIELLRDGLTVAEAGARLGISRGTAFRRLRLVEEDAETGVVKLLNAKALDLAENWVTAARVASEKGDHRPAKDALLHAKAIEPIEDTSGGNTRVAIIIGTPDQPIRVSPPQVIVGESES